MGVSQTFYICNVQLWCNVADGQVPVYGQRQHLPFDENDNGRPDVIYAWCYHQLRTRNADGIRSESHAPPSKWRAYRKTGISAEWRCTNPCAWHHDFRSECDTALCSGRIFRQLQAAPCSGVAGRSYLHADSCHGLQRRAGRRIQLQPHGSKHLETFLASRFVGKDRL